jgi:hypothetical protein
MNPKSLSALFLVTLTTFNQCVKASYRTMGEVDSQEGVTSPPDDDDSIAEANGKHMAAFDAKVAEAEVFGSSVDIPDLDGFDFDIKSDDEEESVSPINVTTSEFNRPCVNQIINPIRYNPSAETVEYFYNISPLAFQRVDERGVHVLIHASQEQIDHLIEKHGNDHLLMERIFEVCCDNKQLRLPREFFRVQDPVLALRRIEYARKHNAGSRIMKLTHLKPQSLKILLPDGETLLTRALSENNLDIMLTLLSRDNPGQLILLKNARNQNVFEFIYGSEDWSTEHKNILLHEVLQSIPKEYSRQHRNRIYDFFREFKSTRLFRLIDAFTIAAGENQRILYEVGGEVVNIMAEEEEYLCSFWDPNYTGIMPKIIDRFKTLAELCPDVKERTFAFVARVLEKYSDECEHKSKRARK